MLLFTLTILSISATWHRECKGHCRSLKEPEAIMVDMSTKDRGYQRCFNTRKFWWQILRDCGAWTQTLNKEKEERKEYAWWVQEMLGVWENLDKEVRSETQGSSETTPSSNRPPSRFSQTHHGEKRWKWQRLVSESVQVREGERETERKHGERERDRENMERERVRERKREGRGKGRGVKASLVRTQKTRGKYYNCIIPWLTLTTHLSRSFVNVSRHHHHHHLVVIIQCHHPVVNVSRHHYPGVHTHNIIVTFHGHLFHSYSHCDISISNTPVMIDWIF